MDKEEYVFNVFGKVAEGYDRANLRISLGRHLLWKEEGAKMLEASLPRGGKLLDICCGTGDMTELMLRRRVFWGVQCGCYILTTIPGTLLAFL